MRNNYIRGSTRTNCDNNSYDIVIINRAHGTVALYYARLIILFDKIHCAPQRANKGGTNLKSRVNGKSSIIGTKIELMERTRPKSQRSDFAVRRAWSTPYTDRRDTGLYFTSGGIPFIMIGRGLFPRKPD